MSRREEVLVDLLWEVNRSLHDRIKVVLEDLDLPFVSTIILREVDREPGVTVSELSRRCRIAKSHVSKTVESLSQKLYVEKRPDPSDQRVLRVYPTEEARDRMAQVRGRIRRRLADLIEPVQPETKEDLIKGLKALRSALREGREAREARGARR